jgi:hypothetical protein
VPFQMLIDLRTEQAPDETECRRAAGSCPRPSGHLHESNRRAEPVWPSKMLTLVVTLRVLKIG